MGTAAISSASAVVPAPCGHGVVAGAGRADATHAAIDPDDGGVILGVILIAILAVHLISDGGSVGVASDAVYHASGRAAGRAVR